MSGWAVAGKVAGDLANTALSAWSASELNSSNWRHQKELAQNQIQWRVEDAKKAGLHPLAALGVSPSSYSPATALPDYSGVGDALSTMGQAIDKDKQDAKTAEQQQIADMMAKEEFDTRMQLLRAQVRFTNAQVEGATLQNMSYTNRLFQGGGLQSSPSTVNMMTASRIPGQVPARVTSGLVDGSGFALRGQGDVVIKPAEQLTAFPRSPSTEAGFGHERKLVQLDDGGVVVTPSEQFADSTDDDVVSKIGWHMRNSLPGLWDGKSAAPPKSLLPKGATEWVFNTARGAWYPNTHAFGYKPWEFKRWRLWE